MALTEFPRKIAAGLTVRAAVFYPDRDPASWAATAYLRGPHAVDLVAVAEGDAFLFEMSAAQTAALPPGGYALQVRGEMDGEVVEFEAGKVIVAANIAALSAGADLRSHAEKVLASIEAVIEGRASKDQQSYSINGRSLQRTPIADLMLLRSKYREEVKLQSGARPRTGRLHRVRMK